MMAWVNSCRCYVCERNRLQEKAEKQRRYFRNFISFSAFVAIFAAAMVAKYVVGA